MAAVLRLTRLTFGALVTSLIVACSGASPKWLQTAAFGQVQAAPGEGDWPESTAGAYLVGRFALDQGEVATAVNQFEQALKADPKNVELLRQIFVLKLFNGEFDTAGAREVLASEPDADEARLLLALAAAKAGRYRQAQDQLAATSERGVGSVVAPLLKAWALAGEKELDAARSLLDGERREDGFQALRSYHLGALELVAGNPERARDLLRPLVTDAEATPVRLLVTCAAALARAGDLPAARALLERQRAFFDGNPLLDQAIAATERGQAPTPPIVDAPTGMADALLSLAAALQEQAIGTQAIVYARLATFIDPAAGDAWLVIGRSFTQQNNYRKAVEVYDAMPASSPYKWSARLARAEALAQLERVDEAVKAFQEMAAERQERIEPLVSLGDLLRNEERFAEAEQAYSEALSRLGELQPGHWRLLYARGITRERTDRWPGAEADFLKALEIQPEQPYVLNYLGYSWVDRGENLDRAKGMLHRAVELRPEDGFIVDSLGWAYYKLEDFAEAVEYLERAVELQPGDPVINDHLGDAYWRVGREREARFQWKRALVFDPEDETVAEIERKLLNGLEAKRPDRG